MPNRLVRLGDLRRIDAKAIADADLRQAVEMNQKSRHPDKLKLAVPESMAELIPSEDKSKDAEKPAVKSAGEVKSAGKPTVKSGEKPTNKTK